LGRDAIFLMKNVVVVGDRRKRNFNRVRHPARYRLDTARRFVALAVGLIHRCRRFVTGVAVVRAIDWFVAKCKRVSH